MTKDAAFANITHKTHQTTMIKVRLQIADGTIEDTADKYGLVYIKADNRFAAPLKGFETSKYAEQPGSNINPKTVEDEFDYKVEFFIRADGDIGNANAVIANFNALLYTQDADNIKTFKQVTFYNDYKKVKIVGYPSLISEATDFWRDSRGRAADVVCAEWTIKVNDPTLCDFNITDND